MIKAAADVGAQGMGGLTPLHLASMAASSKVSMSSCMLHWFIPLHFCGGGSLDKAGSLVVVGIARVV